MKLPTPILLHLVSVGLLAFIGWAVYEMVPLYKPGTQDAAQKEGMVSAKDRLARGAARDLLRKAGPTGGRWRRGGPDSGRST